jgi:hypothetical protein
MLSKKIFVIAVLLVSSLKGSTQIIGCTDPHAINYQPDAIENDGSCQYGPTNYSPPLYIRKLDDKVSETSGLVFFKGGLWTINDSGGEAEIYKIDTVTGKVIQTIILKNASNKDWEDITQDSSFLYIGDFGNKAGNRKDLCIYKVSKRQIPEKGNVTVKTEVIYFTYIDQRNYHFNPYHHNFDCEALVCKDDSLFLFTKNWEDNATKVYALPIMPGTYNISPRDSYNVNGLITGAGLSPDGKHLTLVGCSDFQSFITILFSYKNNDFFSGNKRRIDFPGLLVTRTEGVVYTDNENILISTQQSSIPQCIFSVNTGLWTSLGMSDLAYNLPDPFIVKVLYPLKNEKVSLLVSDLPDSCLVIDIFNTDGKKVYNDDTVFVSLQPTYLLYIMTQDFVHGTYFIKVTSADQFILKKLIIE